MKTPNIKSDHYLSCLDIDAEQLWVISLYKEHGILPKIKQVQEIKELYDRKKLTLAPLHVIMKIQLATEKVSI